MNGSNQGPHLESMSYGWIAILRNHGREQMTRRSRKASDRRKGPDIWIKSLSWIGVVGWLLMLVALAVVEKARPQFETFFDRWFLETNLRTTWDLEFARYFFYLMIVGLGISVVDLAINARRRRRKSDSYRISLVLLGLISVVSILIYVF